MTRTKKNEARTEGKAPDLIAWHVENKEGGKGFWTRIGAAWMHEDGNGMTLNLDLMPTKHGLITLRAPKADGQEGAS